MLKQSFVKIGHFFSVSLLILLLFAPFSMLTHSGSFSILLALGLSLFQFSPLAQNMKRYHRFYFLLRVLRSCFFVTMLTVAYFMFVTFLLTVSRFLIFVFTFIMFGVFLWRKFKGKEVLSLEVAGIFVGICFILAFSLVNYLSPALYKKILSQKDVKPILIFSNDLRSPFNYLPKKYGNPWDMVVDEDERTLYVSFHFPSHKRGEKVHPVIGIDLARPLKIHVFPSVREAENGAAGVCLNPEKNLLYVVLRGKGIAVMDTKEFTLDKVIPLKLRAPILLYCDMLHEQLVVGAEESTLQSLSLESFSVKKTIKTRANPTVFVPSVDGKSLYVCGWIGTPLVKVNLKTFSVGHILEEKGMFPPPLPIGCTLDEKHREFYSTDYLKGTLQVRDTKTYVVKRNIKIMRGLRGLIFDTQRKVLYAGNYNTGFFYVLDPQTGKIIKELFVGSGIRKIYISPKTYRVFVASRYGIFEIVSLWKKVS